MGAGVGWIDGEGFGHMRASWPHLPPSELLVVNRILQARGDLLREVSPRKHKWHAGHAVKALEGK